MIKTEKIIIKKDKVIEQWLKESTAIYNQCLYFLRQEYFAARNENRSAKYKSVNELYHLLKNIDCWKNSNIDIVVKQSIIRQCHSNWFAAFKAFKKFNADKSKFLRKAKTAKVSKRWKIIYIDY